MEGEMVEWDRKGYEEREKEGKKERKKEMTALVLKGSSTERKGQGSLGGGGWATYLRKRIRCAG